MIGALEEGIKQGWIKEEEIRQTSIEGFLSRYGREFYKLDGTTEQEGPMIRLERKGEKIPLVVTSKDGSIEVVPFGRGKEVMSLSWVW